MPSFAFARSVSVFALAGLGGALPLRASGPVTPSPYWKNTITFPDDPFRHGPLLSGDPGWVKFAILTCDPQTVYFQDSNAFVFHYDFVSTVLDPFIGISQEQFDAISHFADGQQIILGTVILPPMHALLFDEVPDFFEFGIDFVRQDAYSPQEIIDLFHLVKSGVGTEPGVEAFYFPTYEQLPTAQAHAALLEANGVPVSSLQRWQEGNACYAEGWALGTLKFFPAGAIHSAYLSGALGPQDVLLTDGVPAEVPFVAGLLSLAPSTPNSHVAILAGTFHVPFAHLALPDDAARAQALVGQRVGLRVYGGGSDCDVRVIDAAALTPQQAEEILALKAPPPLDIQPMQPLGALSVGTDGLGPQDMATVGGKAAHYGILRRSIPDQAPVAVALSFDLWNAFMDQTMPSGLSLGEQITLMLSPYTTYPPDFAALSNRLEDVRDLIEDNTVFSLALRNQIIAILQDPQLGFNPNSNIRFRSSTNVEDSAHFTGAGLYDSFSGCLADDLDLDGNGPSLCDPSEPQERGVFRAIRKVFASFYNDNATVERLRHGVDPASAGMAILVHHSFPDAFELANGVATLTRAADAETIVLLVSQAGAVPVTNPEPNALPEQVQTVVSQAGVTPQFLAPSNLLPLGDHVLEWPGEYVDLTNLLLEAAAEYQLSTGRTEYVLDFEYKKLAPGGAAIPKGGLEVDQIRLIPQPDDTPSITPFLINEPTVLESPGLLPGYSGLKARWVLQTRNMWLDPAAVAAQSIYDQVELTFSDGCSIVTLNGPVGSLPGATHSLDGTTTTDTWTMAGVPNPRTHAIITHNVGQLVAPSQSPILTLRDLGALGSPSLISRVEFEVPIPVVPGEANTVPVLTTGMQPPPEVGEEDVYVTQFFELGPDVTIETSFYLPAPSPICCPSAQLLKYDHTVIAGLTTEPILLQSLYSQAFFSGQHNWFQTWTFEPALEPGLPPQARQELQDLDIRLIKLETSIFEPLFSFTYYGDDALGIGSCNCSPIPYGDADHSGVVDLLDVLCVLDGLAGEFDACPLADVDLAPCGGDGAVGLPDLLAVLDAFRGQPACVGLCPPPRR